MNPNRTDNVVHLPVERSLATLDIARLAGPRPFERGVASVGRVLVRRRTGGALEASVDGEPRHDVRVGFSGAAFEHRCSCRARASAAPCEHVVAVVVAVTSVDDWTSSLQRLIDAADDVLAAGGSDDVLTFCERAAAHLDAYADDAADRVRVRALSERLDDLRHRAARAAR